MKKKYFLNEPDYGFQWFDTKEELNSAIKEYLLSINVGDIEPDYYKDICYGEISHRAVYIPTMKKGKYQESGKLKFMNYDKAEQQLNKNKECEELHEDYCK
jgi:hypothetical protein